MSRAYTILGLFSIAAIAVLLPACGWTALAIDAWNYPTLAAGEACNVVARGGIAYASLGADGIAVIDADAGRTIAALPNPAGTESVDDLSIAGDLLFALDARAPGHLAVLSLRDPRAPALVEPPVEVPVGPFSGVAAAAGRVVVSGGTSELTARRFMPDGRLDPRVDLVDLGRGQPDVALSPDGLRAFVSTHFNGPRFGMTSIALDGGSPRVLGSIEIAGAGFTAGGAKPANFPIVAAERHGRALVACGAGLVVIDVRDELRAMRSIAVPVTPVHLAIDGDRAVIVGSDPQPLVVLLDVADDDAPQTLRSIALPAGSRPTGVALTARTIVVAAGAAGVLLFDRDSAAPRALER